MIKPPLEAAAELAQRIKAAEIEPPEGYEVVILLFRPVGRTLRIGYISEVTERTLRRWLRIFLRTPSEEETRQSTKNPKHSTH